MDAVESSKGTGSSEMEPQMSHDEKNSAEHVEKSHQSNLLSKEELNKGLGTFLKVRNLTMGVPQKMSIDLPKETDSGSHPVNANGTSDHVMVETTDHEMVKETIGILNKHRLHFVQRGDACVQEAKRSSKRPDLKSMNKELTYDYCYDLDSVVGPDGNINELACLCGSASCRKCLC